jgi:hypothetical protein
MIDLTRADLLDLLTTAALIGRDDTHNCLTRGEVTAVVERRMRKQLARIAPEPVAVPEPTGYAQDVFADMAGWSFVCSHCMRGLSVTDPDLTSEQQREKILLSARLHYQDAHGDLRTIPQHNRPDGTPCPFSACTTTRADASCPDRCDSAAEAAGIA